RPARNLAEESLNYWGSALARISYFYGLGIYMFPGDHGIPHFHGYYAEYDFKISITTGRHMEGDAPAKVIAMAQKWAAQHRDELMENWRRCKAMTGPFQVAPLS